MATEMQQLPFVKRCPDTVQATNTFVQRHLVLFFALIAFCMAPTNSFAEDPGGPKWGVMLFGGQMSERSFIQTINPTVKRERTDIFFTGVGISRKIWGNRFFDVELEGGLGFQFADGSANDTAQVWGAAYLRYKYFPWNKFIHTTVAINTGLNYFVKKVPFEIHPTKGGGTSNLMHYLAPEITFSLPQRKDWELVFRLHHRSAIFGLMGCDNCGSNIVAVGVRKRF